MAEQVYVYGASQGVRPASYSYATYTASDGSVGVQPAYSVSIQQPTQGYSYETSSYPPSTLAAAAAAAPSAAGYPQSDYGQQPYAVQVVAASQGYAPQQGGASAYSTPSGSYAAVQSANPYATAVVAPAGATYAPSGDQQLTYTQQGAYAQPSYAQQQQQQQQQQQAAAAAYIQQPQTQPTHIYGQVQVQAPSGQQMSAYGIASAQPAYGQPPSAQQPAGATYIQQTAAPPQQQSYGQPGAQQTTVIYGTQQPTQHATAPAYGQSAPQQVASYGPPTIQGGSVYGQPPPTQQGMAASAYIQQPMQSALTQLPPPQQTAVYVLPSAGPQQPTAGGYSLPPSIGQPQPVGNSYRPVQLNVGSFGRPMSPSDLGVGGPYDQRSVNFPPTGRGPSGALIGPSAVLNAVLGGGRGGSPSFSRSRDGPSRGFGGGGSGGFDRGDNADVGQILNDTVFIQGLPENATEELLAKHFGAVGTLKTDFKTGKPRVWLCRDKTTGRPRGDGIVGFEQMQAASIAIERFHRTDFLGATINVRHATKKPMGQQTPAGRGRGDDWICPVSNCNNRNFGWRTECNRCKAPRPGSAAGGDKDASSGPLRGGGDASNDGNSSDREGSPDGRASPGPAVAAVSPRGTAPSFADRDSHSGRGGFVRGGAMRGGRDMGRGGFGGRGIGGGGMMRGRGGPIRGGARFERRDHPY